MGIKWKRHGLPNLPNLKNIRHFVNFHRNFLNLFLVKQIMKFFHLIIAFGSNSFCYDASTKNMDDHFQRPLWPFFISFSRLALMLEHDHWCQLSPKNFWEVLMKIEGIQALYPMGWINPLPPIFLELSVSWQRVDTEPYILGELRDNTASVGWRKTIYSTWYT